MPGENVLLPAHEFFITHAGARMLQERIFNMSDDINPELPVPANPATAGTAEGQPNVSEPAVNLKDVINAATNRSYATDQEALEAVKNTYKMVGAKPEPAIPQDVLEKLSKIDSLESTLKQNSFYSEHPEYNIPEVKGLITAMGQDPESVVKQDSFQTAFKAIQTAHEMEKTKSVLNSNPRLGQVSDKMTEAREQSAAGNTALAAQTATKAVLEAYEIK